jgi:hypothetical protein
MVSRDSPKAAPAPRTPGTSAEVKTKCSMSCPGSVNLITNGLIVDHRRFCRSFPFTNLPRFSAGRRRCLALGDSSLPDSIHV